jgi:hypothetical protein
MLGGAAALASFLSALRSVQEHGTAAGDLWELRFFDGQLMALFA